MNKTVNQFEDLKSWQQGRELARMVYDLTHRSAFSKDFALRDQIRRAVISITSNIAEGFERDGRQEFIQFLSIAKGSCGEVRSQLYLAEDQSYVDVQEANQLRGLAFSISRLIAGLMTYLRRTEYRGTKYSSVVREGPDPANEDAWTIHPEELADYETEALANSGAPLET
ncbi:MAG: four helix bundle protein [Prosthecobacter sp.]|nr:four helix bundle protein [Prosthecobacter sp.]